MLRSWKAKLLFRPNRLPTSEPDPGTLALCYSVQGQCALPFSQQGWATEFKLRH
jgi:hypothetical protein